MSVVQNYISVINKTTANMITANRNHPYFILLHNNLLRDVTYYLHVYTNQKTNIALFAFVWVF